MKKYIIMLMLSLGTLIAQAQVIISPDNNKIEYWGRIDFSNPQIPAFTYSGVTIKAKFTGTSIKCILNDYASHTATTTNYFYKIVDGGTPVKFEALYGTNTYELATGLSSGSHTIEIIKLTESSVGRTDFRGFILDNGASLQNLDNQPTCSIEFIGDSQTCGYGNEISTTNPGTGFHSINENNYQAWGYITARNLGMKYNNIAVSGRGLYRNNDGSTNGILPQIYDRVYPDNGSIIWSHSKNHLAVIVINLGTNDFYLDPANAVSQTAFKKTYFDFVKKLIDTHPNALVICATGVMMSDWYPVGANQLTRINNYVKSVVDSLNNNGYKRVYQFKMNPQNSPYGEDWHPNISTHTSMANELTAFIKKIQNYCSVVTEIETKAEDNSIILYPNPTTEYLTIQNITKTPWKVFDMRGLEIISGEGNTVNTGNLIEGLYILEINNTRLKFQKITE